MSQKIRELKEKPTQESLKKYCKIPAIGSYNFAYYARMNNNKKVVIKWNETIKKWCIFRERL